MALREFTEFANPPLQFPYRGKLYSAPEIGIELGLRLNGITNDGEDDGLPFVDLAKLVLGPLWDELLADGVPITFATRAAETVICDFQYGRDYAELYWETGADPKAMAQAMKVKGNRATRRSRSTGGATKTPSRASTKATTSPQT